MTSREPYFPAGFEEIESTEDVSGDEIGRGADGAVDVGFGGQVENVCDLMFDDDLARGREITEVHFLEDVFWVVVDAS